MGVEIIRLKANSVRLNLPTGTELGNINTNRDLNIKIRDLNNKIWDFNIRIGDLNSQFGL